MGEVPRQEFPIKDLHLTSLKAKFPFSARSRVVSKAWKSEDISGKWAASSWAKRMQAKNRRSSLNDFDRFKLMKAKSARNNPDEGCQCAEEEALKGRQVVRPFSFE